MFVHDDAVAQLTLAADGAFIGVAVRSLLKLRSTASALPPLCQKKLDMDEIHGLQLIFTYSSYGGWDGLRLEQRRCICKLNLGTKKVTLLVLCVANAGVGTLGCYMAIQGRPNHTPVGDPTCKLKMGDVVEVELSLSLPDKSLTEYREEIQRMYNQGLPLSNAKAATRPRVGLRS
ncbi:hypothetical protein LIER_42942 [Lithospermum erythrorhizon]|uniref:Uncharacterized protein n=1 Tax=Lithospermum erythrorhizon TaxID=34254 RepID=A0AAV3PB39_LITER